jgi:hypothetical protein
MRALIALLVLCAVTYSCAITPKQRVDRALKQIDIAVDAYSKAHPAEPYPHSFKELAVFAASIGKPIDVTQFSKITLERRRRTFMSISYVTREPSPSSGALAYGIVYSHSRH